MTTLCGHERDDWRGALRWWLRIEPFEFPKSHELRRLVQQHVHDPAKLVELMASEAKRCGFANSFIGDIATVRGDCSRPWLVFGLNDPKTRIVVQAEFVERDMVRFWVDTWWPTEARAILAALLQLPDGAREQAERVLRGNLSADLNELLHTIPMRERLEPRRFDPDPDRESES